MPTKKKDPQKNKIDAQKAIIPTKRHEGVLRVEKTKKILKNIHVTDITTAGKKKPPIY